ncbi:DUF5683 domain-containing protein [Pyrinomonas methylaliphatogenes]|nr:hypothetical protein [Pyrinomonas methylaliphatogenes]MBX5477612.1 B-box zinc finger protein [Pyrinomonas methylaliphatogenes]
MRNCCAFHPSNPAYAQCSACARPLCPACDHRVRGFPYCQDCIVAGVELLRQRRASQRHPITAYTKVSPFGAMLLSFIVPGLGAAYNGQTAKALVHFVIFASLFQLATATNGAPIFVFGGIGIWFYAALDAYRTARLIRAGLLPDTESDAIARHLIAHPVAWGITLLCLGTLFLLQTVFGWLLQMRIILPSVLIVLGTYLIYDRWKRGRRAGESRFDWSAPPSITEDRTMRFDRELGRGVRDEIKARDGY